MSRQYATFARFLLLVLVVTAVLTLTVHAAPTSQESPRPRYNLEDIPYQPATNSTTANESALAVTAPNVLLPWSKVTFQSLRNGSWDIFVGNDDGTGQTAVVSSGSSEIQPNLNRGNTKIVYASNSGGDYEIVIANVNGSGQTALTSNTTSDGNPSWSPDGSKIIFEAYRNGEADIYVMNANGTNQVRLTTHPDFDGMPTWSPDGSKIAFVSRRTGGYRIYVMNADGTGQTQLSNQPYSLRPQWSPDGSQIAYDADNDADGWQDLWRMNADGSSQTLVYNPGGQTDAWASSWSPDGRFIAYTVISFVQYQGNWYWTDAYLRAVSPNGGFHTIGYGNRDWEPNWQTNDNITPSSYVQAMPAQSPGPIYVRWISSEGGGSGIKNYDVQVKIGTGSWVNWLVDTAETAAWHPGIGGQTYAFRVRASDNSFNAESYPATADATTTVENLPPVSHITTLPLFRRYDENLSVNWEGSDPGFSGIQTYDVQYRINNGTWVDWHTGVVSTTAVLEGGTSGDQYDFRVRALDNAQNQGIWSTGSNNGTTTFYAWGIEGFATDNTGAPVSDVEITTNPPLLGQSTPDILGFFGGYVEAENNSYNVSWNKDIYTALPSTTFSNGTNGEYAVVMPPANNVIADWGFESGSWNNGWQPGGTLPPIVTDAKFHSGQYAAMLGQPLAFNEGVVPNIPDNWGYHFDVDDTGTGHMIFFNVPGSGFFYQQLRPDGGWSAVEFIGLPSDLSIGTRPTAIFENDGRIHLFWLTSSGTPNYDVSINYLQRQQNGQWTEPKIVVDGLNTFVPLQAVVDSNDTVHVLYGKRLSTTSQNALFYVTGKNDSWSTPQKFSLDDFSFVDSNETAMKISSNGTLHIIWIEVGLGGIHKLYYRERSNGSWHPSVRLIPQFSNGDHHFYHINLLTDEQDNIHLFWENQNNSEVLYYLEKRSSGGWQVPLQLLSSEFQYVQWPQYAVSPNNELILIYFSAADGVRKVIYQIRNEKGEWQKPQDLRQETEDAAQNYSLNQIDMDVDASSTTHIVWTEIVDNDTMEYQVIYVRKRLVGKPEVNEIWSGIEEANYDYFPARVFAHSSGQPTLFWQASSKVPLHYRVPDSFSAAGTYAISTEILVPDASSNPVLSFLYDLSGAIETQGEVFTVRVDDGIQVATILSTSTVASWRHFWYDISPWAGKTVTLTFEFSEAANTSVSHVAIDEVTIGTSYPDLWVANSNTRGAIGERVTHTVSFGNQGGATAENVTVTFKIPVGLAYRGSNVTPSTVSSQEITWDVDSLTAKSNNQAIEIELEILPAAPGFSSLLGQVDITTSSVELEMLNNHAVGTTFIGTDTFLPVLMNP